MSRSYSFFEEEKIAWTKLFQAKQPIVTGASSGIGYATASALAAAGAAVVINARRKDRLEKLASGIGAGWESPGRGRDAGVQSDIDMLLERALSWDEGQRKFNIVVVNAVADWQAAFSAATSLSGGRCIKSTFLGPPISCAGQGVHGWA